MSCCRDHAPPCDIGQLHSPSKMKLQEAGSQGGDQGVHVCWRCAACCYLCVELVGALKDGYICKIPLPRVPRVQSTSDHVASAAAVTCDSADTSYLQVPCVPTWRDLTRKIAGFGRRTIVSFPLYG